MKTTTSQIDFQQFIAAYAQVYKDGGTYLDLSNMLGMTLNQIKCRKRYYKKFYPIPNLKFRHGNRHTKKNT